MNSVKETRRKAIKTLAIGAPALWAKPVVDSVVLPTHAQASGDFPLSRCCSECPVDDVFGLLTLDNGTGYDLKVLTQKPNQEDLESNQLGLRWLCCGDDCIGLESIPPSGSGFVRSFRCGTADPPSNEYELDGRVVTLSLSGPNCFTLEIAIGLV